MSSVLQCDLPPLRPHSGEAPSRDSYPGRAIRRQRLWPLDNHTFLVSTPPQFGSSGFTGLPPIFFLSSFRTRKNVKFNISIQNLNSKVVEFFLNSPKAGARAPGPKIGAKLYVNLAKIQIIKRVFGFKQFLSVWFNATCTQRKIFLARDETEIKRFKTMVI